MTYDVIVVGVGGMGSAACWQLARRGQSVLGLERFDIPHSKGSAAPAERFIAGAHERGAGTLMLDLEDSIPMEQKQAARATLPAVVASLRQRGQDVWIRLNNRPEHLWLDVAACVLDGAEAKAGLAPGAVMAAAQIETPLRVLSAQTRRSCRAWAASRSRDAWWTPR